MAGDDDVDETTSSIEEYLARNQVDEEYDVGVDGVILWWRDGDDEDELADTIMDASEMLNVGAPFGFDSCQVAQMLSVQHLYRMQQNRGTNASTPETVAPDWNGIRLRAFGRGPLKT